MILKKINKFRNLKRKRKRLIGSPLTRTTPYLFSDHYEEQDSSKPGTCFTKYHLIGEPKTKLQYIYIYIYKI
jgi:hypothetical protein